MKKNCLITGIPRSGTSLLSSLIAKNQKAVVFSEPEWLKALRNHNPDCEQLAKALIAQTAQLRYDIQSGKPVALKINAETKHIISNYYERNEKGQVITNKNEILVKLDKTLSKNPFYIKSNAQFSACLKQLVKTGAFKIYCIIRNPVSCIMSWRSLNIPVSQGNMKIAEKYSDNYCDFISSASNLLHKQVLMIDWYFKSFSKHSEFVKIIRYEDLLANPQKIISNITGNTSPQIFELKPGNKNTHYDHSEQNIIIEYLNRYGHYYKTFYEY